MARRISIDQVFVNRRKEAEKREKRRPAPAGPKSLTSAIQLFRKAVFEETDYGHVTDGVKLKAHCNRLKNRNITVGNTVFCFDDEGNTEVVSSGNVLNDYNVLIRMNGVTEIKNK